MKETSPHARGQPGKSRIRRPSAVRGSAGEAVCISMSCMVVRCFAAVPGYLHATNTPRDRTGDDAEESWQSGVRVAVAERALQTGRDGPKRPDCRLGATVPAREGALAKVTHHQACTKPVQAESCAHPKADESRHGNESAGLVETAVEGRRALSLLPREQRSRRRGQPQRRGLDHRCGVVLARNRVCSAPTDSDVAAACI